MLLILMRVLPHDRGGHGYVHWRIKAGSVLGWMVMVVELLKRELVLVVVELMVDVEWELLVVDVEWHLMVVMKLVVNVEWHLVVLVVVVERVLVVLVVLVLLVLSTHHLCIALKIGLKCVPREIRDGTQRPKMTLWYY